MATDAELHPNHGENFDVVPPLDVGQMVDVTGGDPELVRELFMTFRKETLRHIGELRDAVARGDVLLACDAAHSIKGSAATMGYNQVRDASRALEIHAKAGRMAEVEASLAPIESALARLEEAVKTFDPVDLNSGTG